VAYGCGFCWGPSPSLYARSRSCRVYKGTCGLLSKRSILQGALSLVQGQEAAADLLRQAYGLAGAAVGIWEALYESLKQSCSAEGEAVAIRCVDRACAPAVPGTLQPRAPDLRPCIGTRMHTRADAGL
jgi:hypothetical protein